MESRPPAVSVIIPTFNSSVTLREALRSVRAQDFGDFEILVVGDACTDDSEQVVHSFGDPRISWRNLDVNSGSQSAPNREGLRHARGEWVAYLGHDDLWFPWHLSGLVAAIRASGADLVHSMCLCYAPSGPILAFGPPRPAKLSLQHFIPPSAWLHRRLLATECGFWRDPRTLFLPVDHDCLDLALRAGRRIQFHPRLSVVKFPSMAWKLYSRKSGHPQPGALDAILADPAAAESRAMRDFASVRTESPSILRRLLQRCAHSYGCTRFPLKQFLVWRRQRHLKRARTERGLTGAGG